MKRFSTFALSMVMVGAWATASSAQHLIISNATSTTAHPSRPIAFTYDDSGMSGDSGSAGATNDTHNNNPFDMGLLINEIPPLFIEYDLGQSYDLTNLVVWGYNENTWWRQGMKAVTITVRDFGGDAVVVYDGNVTEPPGRDTGTTTPSLDIDLTGITGRFIHFLTDPAPEHSWRATYTDPPITNDFACGLSEVRVYGDPTGLGNGDTQACCFPDGSCSNLAAAACTTAGGIPEGTDTECFSTVCPQLEEACCFPDGTCDDIDPNDCIAANGIPQGPGTTCAGVSCPQPEACCLLDGSCEDLLVDDCISQGGYPQGIFTTCAGTTCDQPEACCLPDSPWCDEMVPAACADAGGTSLGVGTACYNSDCVGATEAVVSDVVEMGVTTLAGYRFDLERATSLNPDWTDTPAYLIAGGASATLVGDDDSDPHAFYRSVGFVPPPPCGIASAIGNPSAGNNWSTESAVSVRASNPHPSRSFQNVINGSGISADGCTHTDALFGSGGVGGTVMGFNLGPTSGPARAGTVAGANWVEFAFDQAYNIFDILVWNYNEDSSNAPDTDFTDFYTMQGMKEVTIQYTTVGNGGGWGSDSAGDWTTLGGGTMLLLQGTGGNFLGAQAIPMDATAQYVVITAVSGTNANFMCEKEFGSTCTTPSVEGALSEVRFTLDDPPAPPPGPEYPINPADLADVTGLSFASVSGVVYELERAVKAIDPTIGSPNAGNEWDTTSAVSIVGHSGTRDPGTGEAGRTAINTINGNGMLGDFGNLHNNGIPHGQMAMFANPPAGGDDSPPNPGTLQSSGSHWITYELDQEYSLADVTIWNYNETSWYVQGWKSNVVQVSTNNGTNPSDWTTVFEGELPISPGGGTGPSEAALVVDVGDIPVKYVTLINPGIGDDATWLAGDDGSHAGLSEVRFHATYEPPPDIANAVFTGTGMFTVGDGNTQTLFDPDGWDPDTYWYRVSAQ